MRVLAAVDGSAATRPVLEAGQMFAGVLGASLEAIYVGRRVGAVGEMAARAGVPLRVLHGLPEQVIAREAANDDVELTIIGTRGLPRGGDPTGPVTLYFIQQSPKAVAVVPPECAPAKLERVLVPVDSPETSLAVAEVAEQLTRAGAELVVIYAFTVDTTPAMLDHANGLELWGDEFLRRGCPDLADARLELRIGTPSEHVIDVARDEDVDLIVLAWSRDISDGHGQIVLDTLGRATVPTLLLPMETTPGGRRPTAALVAGSGLEERWP